MIKQVIFLLIIFCYPALAYGLSEPSPPGQSQSEEAGNLMDHIVRLEGRINKIASNLEELQSQVQHNNNAIKARAWKEHSHGRSSGSRGLADTPSPFSDDSSGYDYESIPYESIPISPKLSCLGGQVLNVQRECACPNGQTLNQHGLCVSSTPASQGTR